MSITGIGLILFLVGHVSGNLLLFKNDGGVAFNEYAHFMGTNPIVRIPEVIIFLGFIFHIVDGIMLTIKNRKARSQGYVKNAGGANSTWASRSMGFLGIILLIFLVIHLSNFFVKARLAEAGEGKAIEYAKTPAGEPMIAADGEPIKDLYAVVESEFEVPWYSALYVICMIALAFHLYHGFWSAFQTLGVNHPKYNGAIKATGVAFCIIVPALFATMPLYFLFL